MRKFTLKHALSILFSSIFFVLLLSTSSCKKDKNTDTTEGTSTYALIIENGAQKIAPNGSVTYTAKLLDNNGEYVAADNVSWSSSSPQVATISNSGVVATVTQGTVGITATAVKDGVSYTATVPLGIYSLELFSVAPCALLGESGDKTTLEAFRLTPAGLTTPTCTYQTSDAKVATVSSGGEVTYTGVGTCFITVTATNIEGNPQNIVPVSVTGKYTVPLPVTKVTISPHASDLFKNETAQLTAKGYNSSGEEVTGKTVIWKSENSNIASVNNAGKITPISAGEVNISATIDGIIGQARVIVYPDTMVLVEPEFPSIPAGSSKQFTATAYKITRTSGEKIPGINFIWEIPTFGIPYFDVATVDNNGLVKVKSNAMIGVGSFVTATDVNNRYATGSAIIMVAMASNCDCGQGDPNISSIEVNSTSVNLKLLETFKIEAKALNSSNEEVPYNLVYCSDNVMAASVDNDGTITAMTVGQATIKVCAGNIYKEITVNVTMF